jgi:ABC-type branched-subunit amino acid transport system substrate-binding protein
MMRTRHLAALVVALAGPAVWSCTAITDTPSSQCHSQEDCWARGPEFVDTTCNADRVCVKTTFVERACTTNRQCIEANNGGKFTCRKSDGKCVALESPECPQVFALPQELLDDNIVFFGVAFPQDQNGVIISATTELVQDEVRRTTGGLPALRPGDPVRPIGWVACNSDAVVGAGTVATAIAQEQHLVSLGVAGVFGPLTADSVLPVLTQVAIPAGILSLVPGSVGAVSFLPDNDLVFRTGFSAAVAVEIATPLFTNFLPNQLVADGIMQASEQGKMRVALIQSDEVVGASIGDALVKTFHFNNASFSDNLASGSLQVFRIGDPNDRIRSPDAFAKVPQAITAAQAFKPHVIIYAGPGTMAGQIMAPLSRSWSVATGDAPFPYQISLNGGWGSLVTSQFGTMPAVARKRYIGTNVTTSDADPNDAKAFAANLALFKPDLANIPIGGFGAPTYDGEYMMVYAAASLGPDQPLAGVNMAKAIRKLGAGSVIKWGTADLAAGFAALQGGGQIEFHGVGGTYKFDENGDHPGVAILNCVTAAPFTVKNTAYKFNPTLQTAEGTLDLTGTCGP